MSISIEQRQLDLLRRIHADGRYPIAAYEFLRAGLASTTLQVHGECAEGEPRHVTGRQLCDGLAQLALDTWGPLAQTVLHRWNIRCTRDFGEMVFLLIGAGFLGKQDTDRIEDFDDVFDLADRLSAYEIPVAPIAS